MDRGGVARLTTVPFGRAATDALADVIAAGKDGDPLAPVTVVVPGNLTGLALRRELGARPGGIVNVRFMVLDRLAELLGAGALAAAGRRPLDDAVRAALVRQVLADRPAPLERVAAAHTTEAAVVEFLDELARSDADALDQLRHHSHRGSTLASLVDRFEAKSQHYYDERDVARAAAESVAAGETDLRDVGQVVLHLPHRLSPAQLELVDALAVEGRLWALVGVTGELEADVAASALVDHLDRHLGPPIQIVDDRSVVTNVVSAPDAPGEVREAMRLIASELEAGRPLHRIAVVYRLRDPYAQLLDEELTAAGLPMHGPSVRTLAQSVTGRTLLGALALADDGFSRGEVVRWLSAAPIRVDGRRVRAARWARIARRAGVVRGAEQWTDRLGRYSVDEPDEAPRLAEFVAWLVAEVGVNERPSWSAWADWTRSFLSRALGSPAARLRWPEAELVAYDAVERVVEGFRSLDAVEPGPISRAAVVSHLASMLEAPAGRRGLFGQGVLCGTLAHVVGVDLDVLIVLGMSEGAFPPTGVSAALLSETERGAIGSPLQRGARATDERRTYLSALGAAPTRWLLHPRAGSERVAHPSPWLDGTSSNERMIESFDAELARPSEPSASLQEHDLRALRAWPSVALAQHPLVEHDPELARGLAAIRTRSGDEFSAWDGNVGPSPHLVLDAAVLSATALETWAKCPAQYLFRYVLRVREHDDISDVDELEPRHRGSLVHEVLERLGREHIERRDAQPRLPFGSEVPWAVAASDAAERVADEVFTDFELLGSAPYPLLWQVEKRRIVRDVLRTLASDERAAQLLGVEHKFGRDEQPPFILALPSGRILQFSGAIDRVDRLYDRLRVIDYKTGQRENEKNVLAGIRSGRLLQLPLYGLAAQAQFDPDAPVSAGYWYVSAKGGWTQVSIPIEGEIAERFFATLEAIASGITDGIFPANPGDEGWFNFDHCQYCAYDRVCPPDRDRSWLRISSAPEVQPYVELSEVADDPGDDDD